MSAGFGFSREAVRVKVKKCEGNLQPEWRKFSVDPQITSFEVLQSILVKAFDLKGDFSICYRILDVPDHEVYLPLLSDWDLDAAFLKAHNISLSTCTEPCLCLRIDLKSFEECSDEWEVRQNLPIITQLRTNQEAVKPSPRLHGIFNQVGKTLNLVQRAFTFGDDNSGALQPPRPPISDTEFRRYLDPVGQILQAKELRSAIYFGGIDPSLRKVVWKHILNVYPDGMTGRERMDYIKRKAAEYVNLRETWKKAIAQGSMDGELAYTTGMVRKDVLRTDRHHPFYAGSDDNQNIASLFNILTTYALNHPKVSYCQGMSDIASPLLVTMNDEAQAYICFCALMRRLSTNFMLDGIAMTQKFNHLAEGLMHYDPEFYNYLKSHQADDLLFCYRWLLLEMKREFAFDDSLRMLEVLWSSLPADPPHKELRLFDVQFQSIITICSPPPVSPLVKTIRENPYTKVCALRRQSSSISLHNYSGKKSTSVKRQIHSLDENVGRSGGIFDVKLKHQSLDDATIVLDNNSAKLITTELIRPRSVSPLETKSESHILNNRLITKSKHAGLSSSMTNLLKTTGKRNNGHFRDLKDKLTATKNISKFSSLELLDKKSNGVKPTSKMVKNLNEFLNFAATGGIKTKSASVSDASEKPKITLTKSSFDDSESYLERTHSSASDDTFDECSPDDSQDYFPMTTSVTRELRLELENLDRQVFGNNNNTCDSIQKSTQEEEEEECVNGEDVVETIEEEEEVEKITRVKCRNSDDIFVWENPLHQTSPKKNTSDNDNAIDADFATIVDERSKCKTVTPIKILNQPRLNCCNKDEISINNKSDEQLPSSPKPEINNDIGGGALTNSCEEVTENKGPTLLPPPNEFGGGNPFLMFLCITVLLQHRDHIIGKGMDYNEMAMHFDKMVRKHNVIKVLNQARQMYARYIRQHTVVAAQQKVMMESSCSGNC